MPDAAQPTPPEGLPQPPALKEPPSASFRELFAWSTYDFANSGYTTVVITTVFNTYFVRIVADGRPGATLLWTLALAASYVVVLATAPVVGAIADYSASKKKFLAWATAACVAGTAGLALVGPGDIWLAVVLLMISNGGYSAGENLVAGFLPELVPQERMGRLSGYGWAWGYFGGLTTLALCLGWMQWSAARGIASDAAVPVTNLLVAGVYAIAALPTFLWLKERRRAGERRTLSDYVRIGFGRVGRTLREARRFRELFKLLVCLTVYQSGINAVVAIAAIFAQETLGFTTEENIWLILLVNISAAVGAFVFGPLQDRIGSKWTIALTLLLWNATAFGAYVVETRETFWIVANMAGIAMGSSQSAGRAMVGIFSPAAKSAEFFGLWGMAVRASQIFGPLSYGALEYLSGSHRIAVLSTATFFIVGLILLLTIDEQAGRHTARTYEEPPAPDTP